MSTAALQRVYVRMLFDPELVARVYADIDAALTDEELSAKEKSWLVACDRRLFSADPLRRRRTLKGLLDEFKASAALAVSATKRLVVLDAFFSSTPFHRTIQHRGSLALAFAEYLISLEALDPRIPAVAAIERAIARARRGRISKKQPEPFDPDAAYGLASHAALATVPPNALSLMQAVEQVLFEISLAPVAALASDGPNLSHLPPLEPGSATLLATRGEDGNVSLEELPEGLAPLLQAAERVRVGADLDALASSAGASIRGLVSGGLLTRA